MVRENLLVVFYHHSKELNRHNQHLHHRNFSELMLLVEVGLSYKGRTILQDIGDFI